MEATAAGTGLLVLIWVLTAISLLIVGLRVVAKVKINHFRLDDVLMIIALVGPYLFVDRIFLIY